MSEVPRALKEIVCERANHLCEYCQSSEWLSGQPGHMDHIIPLKRSGETTADNLCLACPPCNSFKSDFVEAVDPQTGQTAPLFNPRTQPWRDHFQWDAEGVEIIGLTPSGRATATLLQMNRSLVTAARKVWVSVNRHPPDA